MNSEPNRYLTRLSFHRDALDGLQGGSMLVAHPLSSMERYQAAKKLFERKVRRMTYAFSFAGTALGGAVSLADDGSIVPVLIGAAVGALGYRLFTDEDDVKYQVDPAIGKPYLIRVSRKVAHAQSTFDSHETLLPTLSPSSETLEAAAALRSDFDAAFLVFVNAIEAHGPRHEVVKDATDPMIGLAAQIAALHDVEKERAEVTELARFELPTLTSVPALARAVDVVEETTREVKTVLAAAELSPAPH